MAQHNLRRPDFGYLSLRGDEPKTVTLTAAEWHVLICDEAGFVLNPEARVELGNVLRSIIQQTGARKHPVTGEEP